MIDILYSKYYNIRYLDVKPEHQGHFGVARRRLYLILTLKGRVVEVANPEEIYELVSSYIMNFVHTEPKERSIKSQISVTVANNAQMFVAFCVWVLPVEVKQSRILSFSGIVRDCDCSLEDYMVSTTAEYFIEASKTARTRQIPVKPAPGRKTLNSNFDKLHSHLQK